MAASSYRAPGGIWRQTGVLDGGSGSPCWWRSLSLLLFVSSKSNERTYIPLLHHDVVGGVGGVGVVVVALSLSKIISSSSFIQIIIIHSLSLSLCIGPTPCATLILPLAASPPDVSS